MNSLCLWKLHLLISDGKASDTWSVDPVWLNTSLHPPLHLDNRYQLLVCSEAIWNPVSQFRRALKLLDIFKNWITHVTVVISQVLSNTDETTVWCWKFWSKIHCLCCSQQSMVIIFTGAPEGSIPQMQPVTRDVLLRRGDTLPTSTVTAVFPQWLMYDSCTIINARSLNRNRSQHQKIIYMW